MRKTLTLLALMASLSAGAFTVAQAADSCCASGKCCPTCTKCPCKG